MVGGAVNAALANFSKALAGQGLQDDVNVNWINPGRLRLSACNNFSRHGRVMRIGVSMMSELSVCRPKAFAVLDSQRILQRLLHSSAVMRRAISMVLALL